MSTGSSENDVIRTRIPTYDDDNTVLYAFEPNIAFFHKQANIVPGTPTDEDKEKTVKDVLTHCQVIHDAIQNLDKKFDVIHGKVSKIQRHRSKSFWQHRKKPLGYKHHSHLHPKKNKYQKPKKGSLPEFEHPESYSPTLPVSRRGSDCQPNYSDLDSDPELEQRLFNDQERDFSQSPTTTSALPEEPRHFYYTQDDPGPSSRPCYSSPRATSTASVSLFSPTSPDDNTVPELVLSQSEPDQQNDPEEAHYPDLLANKNISHRTLCIPSALVTSPAPSDFSGWKQTFYKDPSNWTVEDVMQFVKQIDPQMALSLTDIFRQCEIDGRALLLLRSDAMMKYMGLKLGTTVKLCHYIERLRQDNYLNS